ncbi:MAG: RdgB/HAM1 family non-canonical purine NTP pyrophosphatase [Bacteroidota bacterium]
MKIVFATNNKHKLEEIKALLDEKFDIIGLKEVGIEEEVPEDHATLEENASQKARYIYNLTGENCFADDTGLEVWALDGEPGVYSARYSRIGNPVFPEMETTEGNIRKLLLKLDGVEERKAQFKTVIALIIGGSEYHFEGVIEGEIKKEPSGSMGFGYDPVFIPVGYQQSFAEMALSEKNRISHRAKAVQKLVQFLKEM